LWICIICVAGIIASVIFCRPYLGIAFIIISIPFEGVIDFGYISIYPLEAILAIFVLVYIYKSIVARSNYLGNMKLVYCCIPFLVCIMLSTMKSIEFSSTAKEVVRWVELFLIYYLTINLINDNKRMRVILYSMFLSVTLVSILWVFNCLSMGHRADSLFDNPNPLAAYIGLIIPVLFGVLMACVTLWERVMLGVLSALSVIALFLSFSRSGWLSLILTMVLVFFLTKTNKRVLLFLALLFAIFAIIFLSSDIKNNFIDSERIEPLKKSLEFRAICYTIGLDIVKDNLIYGIGTGNFHLLVKSFSEKATSSIGIRNLIAATHLHSLYLQVFVETGFMGLSAFVFWLVCIVKYLTNSLKALENSRHYWLFVGLMGGVVVYLFNNLTDVLVVHGIHLQWGIILGLAVVLTQFRESKTCLKVT
jgi:putative inorganic carbon (hco3(-)) transporter